MVYLPGVRLAQSPELPYAAGTKDAAAPAAIRRRSQAADEVLFPDQLALLHIDGVDIVRDAGLNGDLLRGPRGVFTRSMISGGNSECICRGSLSRLSFQSSFIFLTLPG